MVRPGPGKLSPALGERIAGVIATRTGLRVSGDARLQSLIESRTADLGLSGEAYLERLLGGWSQEWDWLADNLTVAESSFLRDRRLFELFESRLLPELIQSRTGSRRLRIWSAGCSNGQEPYSLSILASGLVPAGWDLRILGTDVSRAAIAAASDAIYTSWSLRQLPHEQRQSYFVRREPDWELKPRFRQCVRFSVLNLVADPLPDADTADQDLILCRNVLIYFEPDLVPEVVEKLSRCLRPGGYLVTGHGELIGHRRPPDLEPVAMPAAVVFRKPAPDSRSARPRPVRTERPRRPRATPPPSRPAAPARDLAHLLRSRDYQTAAHLAEEAVRREPQNAELLLMAAEARLNLGDLDAAEGLLHDAQRVQPHLVAVEHRLAQVALVRGQWEVGRARLRRCLFLDPDFVPAYLDMARLLDGERAGARADRLRGTALELLRRLAPQAPVDPYSDTTAAALIQQIQALHARERQG